MNGDESLRSATTTIRLLVNGVHRVLSVEARKLLVDVLREDLFLTGTHVGCAYGVCGACTVLIDGSAGRSCLILAAQADGSDITTIEGLAEPDDVLTPLQVAFSHDRGLQCGFCTSGLLMSLTELESRLADASVAADELTHDIRDVVEGHLCRCTGYAGVIRAAESALAPKVRP